MCTAVAGGWETHVNTMCFILTGVLLADEALLNRGGTFVRCHPQTQHLPLAGAAFTHQKGLQAPTTTSTETGVKHRDVIVFLKYVLFSHIFTYLQEKAQMVQIAK